MDVLLLSDEGKAIQYGVDDEWDDGRKTAGWLDFLKECQWEVHLLRVWLCL